MLNFTKEIDTIINTFLNNLGIYGPILGCILIIFESILPILPLFVFITLNFMAFGTILGFIISWVFTIIGCLLSFFLFRKKISNWFTKKISNKKEITKLMNIISKIKLEQLTLIIAVPFTPAFLVNIAAGLSKMSFKKYLIAIIIGKIFLVFFWGFVGTSLVQSLTNPVALIKVVILVLIAYIISKLVNKKFNLD